MIGIRLRPMQARDLPAIFRLEEASQAYPWPHWFFRHNLRRHASCWVLYSNRKIIGFAILAVRKGRAHIMNMCVDAAWRRHGLGRQLLLRLLSIARKRHATVAWLEVRASNRPARRLYRQLGFHETGIHENYYLARNGHENAIIMVRQLTF